MTDYNAEAEWLASDAQIESRHCLPCESYLCDGATLDRTSLARDISRALEAAEKRGRVAGLREAAEMDHACTLGHDCEEALKEAIRARADEAEKLMERA